MSFLTTEHIVGETPPEEFGGLEVQGSYGWLIQSDYIPQGYVSVVASSGPNSQYNPVALRVHENPSYVGLRIIPGNGPYPIQDSHLAHSFGTGVRARGAAAVVQITAGDTYTAPTNDKFGLA